MCFGEKAKEGEKGSPNKNEESNREDCNLPILYMRARPEVRPIPACESRQEEILDEHCNQEPDDNLPAEERCKQGRRFAWSLAIIGWHAKE
jgi:hypothetical protein